MQHPVLPQIQSPHPSIASPCVSAINGPATLGAPLGTEEGAMLGSMNGTKEGEMNGTKEGVTASNQIKDDMSKFLE